MLVNVNPQKHFEQFTRPEHSILIAEIFACIIQEGFPSELITYPNGMEGFIYLPI